MKDSDENLPAGGRQPGTVLKIRKHFSRRQCQMSHSTQADKEQKVSTELVIRRSPVILTKASVVIWAKANCSVFRQ